MSFFKKMWDWLTAATPNSEVPTAPVEADKVSIAPTFDEVKPDTFEPEVKVDSAVVATYAEATVPVAPVVVEEPKRTEKSVAKKTPAKIVPTKKQPVKKTPAKQPAGKKSPAKKTPKK